MQQRSCTIQAAHTPAPRSPRRKIRLQEGTHWKLEAFGTLLTIDRAEPGGGKATVKNKKYRDRERGREGGWNGVMILLLSASSVHLHRLNILTTSVTLHLSRVSELTTFVAHVEFLSLWRGHCQRMDLR